METFDFYTDEKHTIWYRGKFQIEAETYEEAVAKVKEMEKDRMLYDAVDVRWEPLDDTIEGILPEENLGQPTIEVYSEDKPGELIYKNA